MGVLGIVLSVVASQLLGAFWFGDSAFGPMWLESVGRKKEELMNVGSSIHLISAVAKLITAFIFDMFRSQLGVATLEGAIQASIPLSVVIAMYHVTHAPYIGIGVPAVVAAIGYDTLCTAIIAVFVTIF